MQTAWAAFGTLGPFVRNIAVISGELALYRAGDGNAFCLAAEQLL